VLCCRGVTNETFSRWQEAFEPALLTDIGSERVGTLLQFSQPLLLSCSIKH
jgi:hypothetical protein